MNFEANVTLFPEETKPEDDFIASMADFATNHPTGLHAIITEAYDLA